MATLLTSASVRRLKPHWKRTEIRDAGCPGLILIIQPSGRKSWAMRFRRPNGKLARIHLGAVALNEIEAEAEPAFGTSLGLASARRLAADVNRERSLGRDFIAAKHQQKIDWKRKSASTFDKAAMEFVEQHVRRKTRRWQQQARLLGIGLAEDGIALQVMANGLAKRWCFMPISEIDADDIFAIVEEARELGVPGVERRNLGPSESRARKMHGTLSSFFSWLVQRRRIKANPCAGLHPPEPPRSRDRVLTKEEIIALWHSADKLTSPFGACVNLLLLTGCRLNEVCGMRRSELSADGKMWTIPGERTKNHRTHDVPLSDLARQILSEVKSEGDLIFTTNGKTPISGWSKMKKRLDSAMLHLSDAKLPHKIKPIWRLHDLRRTSATGMAEIGILPHIVEACLNHVSGAKAGVAGVYNRAAYAEEKRIAFARWAAHVHRLVSGLEPHVVELRRRA
ncbi:integrase [Bradyrhizobium diazoefficiens]